MQEFFETGMEFEGLCCGVGKPLGKFGWCHVESGRIPASSQENLQEKAVRTDPRFNLIY